MYGIVNRAIEDLVKEKFGDDKWEAIKSSSGVDIDFFLSNEPYPDDITYKLAAATSKQTGRSMSEVFVEFGEWWVLRTTKEKYGGLLAAGGDSLREFLINLPVFHNRVMLMYPKLTPPEFRVSHPEERSIQVHYMSKRVGLDSFVVGILQGLGKMYHVPTTVEIIQKKSSESDHVIFKVSW